MADKKISQLTALSAANLAPSTDVLAIVDTSATETKKIAAQDIVNGVLNVASAVGIGTASPGFKLDVQGSATDFVAFNGLNTNNNAGTITSSAIKFGFTSTVGTHYATLKITEDSVNSNSGGLTISLPNGGVETPLLALTSAGNLGIGTTSPAQKLHVKQSGDGITAGFAGGTYGIRFDNGGTFSSGASTIHGVDSTLTTSYQQLNLNGSVLTFQTSATERARITAGGAFLLGGTSTAQLDGVFGQIIGSSTQSSAGIALETQYGAYMLYTSSDDSLIFYDSGDNAPRARITSGGEFLVNTANAAGTSGVGVALNPSDQGVRLVSASTTNSTETLSVYSTGATAYRFYVGWGGTVYATNTTISAISDQRFKENISDLDVGLDAVLALKPRKFDWKEGKGKDIKGDRGFIAQEFEQVFPDLVDEWRDPAPEGEEPYKSVRQDLIPVLVKAIQEQQAMIKSLEAKVAALEAK
jgi:hypothetical protein